jgi:hypothetical protein
MEAIAVPSSAPRRHPRARPKAHPKADSSHRPPGKGQGAKKAADDIGEGYTNLETQGPVSHRADEDSPASAARVATEMVLQIQAKANTQLGLSPCH